MDEENKTPDDIIDKSAEEIEESAHKKKDKKRDKRHDEIDELTKRCAEQQDKCLRVLAEFDNFRKRTVKEKAAIYDEGVKEAVLAFLPAVDNFQRAMAAASADDDISKGLVMISRQMTDILKNIGVEEIEAVGRSFDPNLHDAVMHVDDESCDSSEIVEELLKGYRYKGKTIRHSMVKVAN